MSAAGMLVVADLVKVFDGHRVLDGVGLILATGSITAVVGASGCGKTTLLRLIAGFDQPDSGSVAIDGRLVAGPSKFVVPQRRNVGYVAQDGALFPHLTVEQNVAYGLGAGRRSGRARSRVTELLEMVSLSRDHGGRRPHELSGGQQQRVALARALARQPVLMLLDEPFSALDTGLRATTRKAVAQTLTDAGVTTLLVTHDQEEALSIADRVAVMRDGRFTQVGAPNEVYATPRDRFTAQFLGDCVLLPATVNSTTADCALGSIPVHPSTFHGAATVMLRPEQLVATVVGPAEEGTGTVVASEYLGSDVVLTIDLPGEPTPIRVRQASIEPPAVDTDVHLDVRGSAVVFGPES
jgi:iron(III) transport system ATP-binding protein